MRSKSGCEMLGVTSRVIMSSSPTSGRTETFTPNSAKTVDERRVPEVAEVVVSTVTAIGIWPPALNVATSPDRTEIVGLARARAMLTRSSRLRARGPTP